MRDLEALEDLYSRASIKTKIDDLNIILNDYDILEKELKALEIIKNKEVHIRAIKMGNGLMNYKFYNKQYARIPDEDLSQEEYELLKEVLSND